MKIKSIVAAFLYTVSFFCAGSPAYGRDKASKSIRPPFLNPGDTVAVVATSYQPTDSTIARSCRLLRTWGFEPVVAPNISANPIPDTKDTVTYYAGDAAQRVAGLKWALENGSVKALICARGGYGAIQMLALLPEGIFNEHPKWLVGYSDVTTLHCALAASGVMSVHGQMCGSLCREGGPDDGALKLRDLLMGEVPEYEVPASRYNSCGRAKGVLVGGNMITMEALLGTGFDPTSPDKAGDGGIILFLEEIDESMHAIDRLFNMLILHDRLKSVRGIVFGDFRDCDRDLPYESVEHMLYQYTSKLGIPVCYGFPAGHGKENVPLVEGAEVILKVTPEKAELRFKLK